MGNVIYFSESDMEHIDKDSPVYELLVRYIGIDIKIENITDITKKLNVLYEEYPLENKTTPEIDRLTNIKVDLQEERFRMSEAISAYRKVCDHKMLYTGHDSHKNYYICRFCGKENWD